MLQKMTLQSGITLQATLAGTGDSVVFLHGLGGNFSFWAGQVRELSQQFRVIRYDLRGHGASTPSIQQTMSAHAQDLYDVLQALEIERTHLIGLSMGGLIAQTFAAKYPFRLQKLVLVSTTATFPPKGKKALLGLAHLAETEGMPAVAQHFAPTLFAIKPEPNDKRYQALAAAFATQDSASFAAAARALAETDVTSDLPSIQAPTLLCFGEKDRQTPPSFGKELGTLIPKAHLHLFPEAGHVLPIEIQSEFNRVLLNFLLA